MNTLALRISLILLTILSLNGGRLAAEEKEEDLHVLPAVEAEHEKVEPLQERLERNRRIWENLSPFERMKLRERFEEWQKLPEPEKERLRENMQRFGEMRQEQQAVVEGRFHQLQRMPVERRRALRNRLEMWQRMPAAKRESVRRFLRLLKRLPPEKIEELKRLPVPERKRVIEGLLQKIEDRLPTPRSPMPPGPLPGRVETKGDSGE